MKQRRERSIIEVNQEIDYLAALSGRSREDFRHQVMGANVTIPAETVPALAVLINNTSLAIINVQDPTTPVVASNLATVVVAGGDDTLYINGTNAYQLDPSGLVISDVSNINSPSVISTTGTAAAGAGYFRIVKFGNFLLLVRADIVTAGSQRNTTQVYNISNLAAPVSLATYDNDTHWPVSQTDPSDAVALNAATMMITSPGGTLNPWRIGFYDVSALPVITQIASYTIAAAGNIASNLIDVVDGVAFFIYLHGATAEIDAYDVSNPLVAPVLLGSLVLSDTNTVVFSQVSSGHIYGLSLQVGDTAIRAIDVSNPAAMSQLASSPVVGMNRNFSVRASNDKVYLATRQNAGAPRNRTIRVYDATNPAALTLDGGVIYNINGANAQLNGAFTLSV